MTAEHSDALARLTARCTDVEAHYTHLEHVVETLNEVVIEQAQRIDALERKLAVLTGQLDTLATQDSEPRSLEDDKPPHY